LSSPSGKLNRKDKNPFDEKHVEEEFRLFDENSDGLVTFAEIDGIEQVLVHIEELKEVFGIIDPTDDYAN